MHALNLLHQIHDAGQIQKTRFFPIPAQLTLLFIQSIPLPTFLSPHTLNGQQCLAGKFLSSSQVFLKFSSRHLVLFKAWLCVCRFKSEAMQSAAVAPSVVLL